MMALLNSLTPVGLVEVEHVVDGEHHAGPVDAGGLSPVEVELLQLQLLLQLRLHHLLERLLLHRVILTPRDDSAVSPRRIHEFPRFSRKSNPQIKCPKFNKMYGSH